jgi:hypothetical protein
MSPGSAARYCPASISYCSVCLFVLVELLLGFIVLFLGLLLGVQLGLHLVLFVYLQLRLLLLLVILILLQLARRPGRWKWVPRIRQRSRVRPAVRNRHTPAER